MKRFAGLALAAGVIAACQSAGDLSDPKGPAATIPVIARTPDPTPEPSHDGLDADRHHREACARRGMTVSECNGRRIWFDATGGNERFYSYTFPQRVGVAVDWYRVLRSDQRHERFAAWGMINDPSCCRPGAEGCFAKSPEETFGFDYCPGDDVLMRYVGRKDKAYVDPSCALRDSAVDPDDPHTRDGSVDPRQSACDLRFGTSAGALGFRKFPNPRFDEKRWREATATPRSYAGYSAAVGDKTGLASDMRVKRLMDASIEPPFLIGTTCGSCHIAFDPLRPPADPAEPKWENITGLVGNQYSRMAEVLASGMPRDSLEWQMFAHPRPGVMDTSAIPHDHVANAGTVNAIINLARRPLVRDRPIDKWRKVASCEGKHDTRTCWCEPGRDHKCWLKSVRDDDETVVRGAHRFRAKGVPSLLKGGEDGIGVAEAVQRVYLNIGSCAEQCWVNHLSDLRQLDRFARNYAQTPFESRQCRRDCPSFRAIEDRVQDVVDFLFSAEGDAFDLHEARDRERRARDPAAAAYTRDSLVADLEREFGRGAVSRGRVVFTRTCAGCHTSDAALAATERDARTPPDFHAADSTHPRQLRRDWMGSDALKPVTLVGTNRCRALHSNHMKGRLYDEYSPADVKSRVVVEGIPQPAWRKDGGRGYYRVISLLNVWATAPYLHNNAVGPEICGKHDNPANQFHRARYAAPLEPHAWQALQPQPECWPYDPSVEGRYALFKQSMRQMLYPQERGIKVTLTDDRFVMDLRIRQARRRQEVTEAGFELPFPPGTGVGIVAGFTHKAFVQDMVDVADVKLAALLSMLPEDRTRLADIGIRMRRDPHLLPQIFKAETAFLRANYWACTEEIENGGHRFGEDLGDADKAALIAFLATL